MIYFRFSDKCDGSYYGGSYIIILENNKLSNRVMIADTELL